jgi:hypothetical protein
MQENERRRNDVWTTMEDSPEHPVARLVKEADRQIDEWFLEDLWQPRTIMLVHSLEGEFKSIFAYQLGEAIATGEPLLGPWKAPRALRVGMLQTEMPDNMVGGRLKMMYPDGRFPQNLIPSDEQLIRALRRTHSAHDKFEVVRDWIDRNRINVLVWDTITNALTACGNPNTEEATGMFYDKLEDLPVEGTLCVRHDGKPSKDTQTREANQKVRGSNRHAEVASTIIQLKRSDKRSNKVQLGIGKLRHDRVPDPVDCWFDAGTMRLTALPPPVVLLLEESPLPRGVLNDRLRARFALGERAADDLVQELFKSGSLTPDKAGHERIWCLRDAPKPDPNIAERAPYPPDFCKVTPAEPIETPEEVPSEDCITLGV